MALSDCQFLTYEMIKHDQMDENLIFTKHCWLCASTILA